MLSFKEYVLIAHIPWKEYLHTALTISLSHLLDSSMLCIACILLMMSEHCGLPLRSFDNIPSTNRITTESSLVGLLIRGSPASTLEAVHSTTRIPPLLLVNSHSNGEYPNHHANSKQPRLHTSVLKAKELHDTSATDWLMDLQHHLQSIVVPVVGGSYSSGGL